MIIGNAKVYLDGSLREASVTVENGKITAAPVAEAAAQGPERAVSCRAGETAVQRDFCSLSAEYLTIIFI